MAEDSPEEDKPAEDTSFEQSRKETRRAQWALNLLVIFSAVAGSVFFFYVLYTIRPFGHKQPPAVNVPTSSLGAKFGLLVGQDEASGVSVVLRDIDEAPSYRARLSDVMRKQMGIEAAGRVYLLVVRNEGKAALKLNAQHLQVNDAKGGQWNVEWLDQASKPGAADAMGKLRLAQSKHNFELQPGSERQLYVFIQSAGDHLPPSAEDLSSGKLTFTGAPEITLSHTEIKASAT
jgi:hypothetical protein